MNYLRHTSKLKANEPTRRRFLTQTGCAGMGMLGMVNTLSHLRLMQGALAQGAGSGYKALVCVFLNGGQDSNNFFMPASGPARTDYDAKRGFDSGSGYGVGVPVANLHRVNPLNAATDYEIQSGYHSGGGTDGPFGFHTRAPHFKTLFDNEDLSVVCNIGTLTYPGVTRANYGSFDRPPQLYSHSDQQKQWQSSVPDKPFTSGWGGRIADLVDPLYNPAAGNVSMNVSISGVNSFMVSGSGAVLPYIMNSNGVVSLSGYGTQYANALVNDNGTVFDPNNYENNDTGKRLKALEQIVQMSHDNLMEDSYNGIVRNARLTEGLVGSALAGTGTEDGTTLDTHFQTAYSGSGMDWNGGFPRQLKMVARLIAGRTQLANTRQIFFVQLGGWDTHLAQNNGATLLSGNPTGFNALQANLSCGLKGFADAIKSLGEWDNVTAFTASDFNRTFVPNKPTTDPTGGTDHAWGGNALIMGGKVRGGRVFGKYPFLKTGGASGSIDSTGSRGRWIPSVSVDQYASVLGQWMGVTDPSALNAIFPNLYRFDDPLTVPGANMNFMDLS